MGFSVGGFELGLLPEGTPGPGPGGTVAYWGVGNADEAFTQLLKLVPRSARSPCRMSGTESGWARSTIPLATFWSDRKPAFLDCESALNQTYMKTNSRRQMEMKNPLLTSAATMSRAGGCFCGNSAWERRCSRLQEAFASAEPSAPRHRRKGRSPTNHLPLDTDKDLLIDNNTITPANGEVTNLSGRILDARGEPVRNATIEIWQADARAFISTRAIPMQNAMRTFRVSAVS